MNFNGQCITTAINQLKILKMNKIEKLVFLEITNKQFTKFPNTDYHDTFNSLNSAEQQEFSKLYHEIHTIFNQINSPAIENVKKAYSSVHEYISAHQVSPIIIKVINDFDLSLKDQITPEFKNLVIKRMGENFYKTHFEN